MLGGQEGFWEALKSNLMSDDVVLVELNLKVLRNSLAECPPNQTQFRLKEMDKVIINQASSNNVKSGILSSFD